MRTATDHLRELAELYGLDTSCNEHVWPMFLCSFRQYVINRDQNDLRHTEAAMCGKLSPLYASICGNLYDAILDDPELWW